MLSKVINFFKNKFFIDANSKIYINFLRQKWPKVKSSECKGSILVELYTVSFTVNSFAYFANTLSIKKNLKIKSFCLSRENSFLYKLKNRRIFHIYKAMGAKKHEHFSFQVNNNLKQKIDLAFNELFPTLKTKEDVINFEYEGFKIGVDLYESYLMRWKKPTLDMEEPYFEKTFKDTLTLIFYWQEYFKKNKVQSLILSHGIYEYGILAKIALKYNIKIYMPAVRVMAKLIDQNDFTCPIFENYRDVFNALSLKEQENGINIAKEQLRKKLLGEVGVNMEYAKKSAFSPIDLGKQFLIPSNKLKVLIATHCFFDNPWAYGKNIFIDFYEWIEYLGQISKTTNYDWYLKTHPDVFPENNLILDKLLKKYPHIHKLPSTASHHQLIKEGISWALTVYGTIGHEYPLLGVNVLNAGKKNPHIAYDFNWNAESLEEYEYLIQNLDTLKKDVNKKQIYEFYYVHNYCSYTNSLFLNSYTDMVKKVNLDEYWSPLHYKYFLSEITDEKHEEILSKIEWFIDSNHPWYYECYKNIEKNSVNN